MSRYDEKEKRALSVFVLFFFLLAAGIFTAGYISYQNFEQQFRAQAESQLSAIAKLKVGELGNWREERLADANVLHQNQVFATLVREYLQDSQNVQLRAQIQDWLRNYQAYKEYDRIYFLDVDGQTRLSIPEGAPPVSPAVAMSIPEVVQSRQVTLVDFYHREDDSNIRLALLLPIEHSLSGDQLLGAVAISIDPEIYLYPFISTWPVESATAETVLVRREGNEVLFLNELRFQKNSILNLRFPLESGIMSAQAALGKTGVMEGMDYRGKPVVATLSAVPASPWFLVAQMDTAEIYAPLRARLWQTFMLMSMAIFVAGAGLTTLWRRQRILFYRRQTDAAKMVLESEKQLKEAQTIARIGSYLFDFSTGRWKSSEVLDKVLGIDEKFDRTTEGWASLIHADDRQYMLDYFTNEVIANRARFDREYRIIRGSDRVERWVHGLGELEINDEDQIVSMLGTIQDITDSKRAEEVIQRSDEKYRRVVETAFEGIIFMDSDTRLTFVNNQMAFMLGYTDEEMLGQRLESFLDEGHLRGRQGSSEERALEMGNVYEQCFKRKDGGKHWTLMSPRAVFDADGNLESFFGMVTDINERKHAEQRLEEYAGRLEEMVYERTRELRDAQEQLVRQERLALLGQVAGSIGHELRNPLGVISNAIYFLKMAQPDAGDKVKEYLMIIENEARASDKIITDLLDFTRLQPVDREVVPVADVIRETFERFPAPLDVTVALDIPADLPMIFVDPHNLVQVLGNLTVNSCQAMAQGGELTISAALLNNMVRINIQDTGIGIPAENMPKLFEPLFTTKTKGIGLGLAVSRKLVEANGGRIEVKSEAGLGSTFTLWLPVADPHNGVQHERNPQ